MAVDSPLLADYVYPFDCSVLLAQATGHVAWIEATTEVFLQVAQMSLQTPVRIVASLTADGIASFKS